MSYIITSIEFSLEACPYCGGDCYTDQTNVCSGYLANTDAVEQIEKASNQVIGQIWEADDEQDLIEEITCAYGWDVKSIDYQQTLNNMNPIKKGELLDKMLVLATNAHSGQFDKGGNPYILHPIKVMHYLRSEDEELQCIALGHDIIEDTYVTPAHLKEQGFTNRIIQAILALTKIKGESYEEYKQKVFSNEDAMKVKMADLRHNTDIRRLKGASEKDLIRTEKYYKFYLELSSKLNDW
jgi:hypothetical protein